MATHAPLPWRSEQSECNPDYFDVWVDDGGEIRIAAVCGRSTDEARDNAEFIVLACNAHRYLVYALRDVLAVLQGKSSGTPEQNAAVLETIVTTALAEAKGTP